MWANEQQLLDEEELQEFERVDRLEQELQAELEEKERKAKETEMNYLGIQMQINVLEKRTETDT